MDVRGGFYMAVLGHLVASAQALDSKIQSE